MNCTECGMRIEGPEAQLDAEGHEGLCVDCQEMSRPPKDTSKKTRLALEKSIAHWERMRDNPSTCGENPWIKDCALCTLFVERDVDGQIIACDGCPVARRTGKPGCVDSPWEDAAIRWKMANCLQWKDEARNADWRDNAQVEIDFLKSL